MLMDYRLWISYFSEGPSAEKKNVLLLSHPFLNVRLFCIPSSESFFLLVSEAFLVMCTDGFNTFFYCDPKRFFDDDAWRLRIRLGFKENPFIQISNQSAFISMKIWDFRKHEIRYYKPFKIVLHKTCAFLKPSIV